MYDIYLTVRSIAVPLGAVGIAGSAVKMITGDVASADKAKKRIIIILIATVGILVIPTVIVWGKQLFSGLTWDPANPL